MSCNTSSHKEPVNSQQISVPATNVSSLGKLVALRTYRETHALFEIGDAYAIEIPFKAASSILKYLENALPLHGQHNLQHLRRFAKPESLPLCLRPVTLQGPARLHFLVCQTSFVQSEDLENILSRYITSEAPSIEARVYRVSIPLQAPVSEEQAREWSKQYWPVVYKRSNPFGPQPASLERAHTEITRYADRFMSIAHQVAAEGKSNGLGEAIGAVIVFDGTLVAVVADGRYTTTLADDLASHEKDNTLAHSVLRGIGFVARKRLSQSTGLVAPGEVTSFQDYPLTPIEDYYYQASSLPENGYLCVDLDIYVTHEPCIMCSMALLHSRFRRVIFGKGMPKTGGLHSSDAGYGIWWRDELNWKMLCWEWKTDDSIENSKEDMTLLEDMHA